MEHTLEPQQPIETTPEIQSTGALSYSDTFTTFDLKQFFNVPPYLESDAITYISQYLQSVGVTSKGSVFQLLRDVEMKLGKQEDRPRAISNYLKVIGQINDLNKVKDSYEYGIR